MAHTFLDWTFEGRSGRWLYVVGVVVLIALNLPNVIFALLMLRNVHKTQQAPSAEGAVNA